MGDYKLLEYFENDSVQLFDLKTDIGERKDLAEAKPEIAQKMLRKLRDWRKSVGARMMEPNPDYDPAVELKKKGKKK